MLLSQHREGLGAHVVILVSPAATDFGHPGALAGGLDWSLAQLACRMIRVQYSYRYRRVLYSHELCEDFYWAVRQSSAAQNLKPNASFIFLCVG